MVRSCDERHSAEKICVRHGTVDNVVRSHGLLADASVYPLTQQVGMPEVAGILMDRSY